MPAELGAIARGAVVGLVAAASALALNRLWARRLDARRAGLWAPVWEELFKTGLALWWGAPLVLAHGSFGLAEAAYELRPKPAAGRARGTRPAPTGPTSGGGPGSGSGRLAAAVLGVAGHLAFGAVAALALGWRGPAAAVAAGIGVHLGYNVAVDRLAQARRRVGGIG